MYDLSFRLGDLQRSVNLIVKIMCTRPLIAAVIFAVAGVTATIHADQIDDLVLAEKKRQRIPGLAVLIVKDGRAIKMRGYGKANLEHQVPVKPQTIFQSGSIGKQFTAAGILLLQEDGKLQFDDLISQHFDDTPPSWKEITIRHLLTHTSGIKTYTKEDVDYKRDYTEKELLQVMAKLPVDFEPGSRWSYSNSGYVVLGVLISKLTGAHWGDFLTERIFQPAGMKTARVISDRDLVSNRSAGYERVEGKLRNQDWVAPALLATGDGALYFSVEDLLAWELTLRDRKIFQPKSYDAWWTPVTLANNHTYPYGFGWRLVEQRGHPVISHGGSFQGFQTQISRYPAHDLSIAVLANVNTANPDIIANAIAAHIESALALPDPKSPPVDPDPKHTTLIKSVLQSWAAAEPHESMTDTLAKVNNDDRIEPRKRKYIAQILKNSDTFNWLADDQIKEDTLYRQGQAITRISYYAVKNKSGYVTLGIYFNEDGKVAHFGRK